MKNYIFSKKINSSSSRRNLLEFLRENSNCEVGGYRIYDGIGNHSLQNPEELTWLRVQAGGPQLRLELVYYFLLGQLLPPLLELRLGFRVLDSVRGLDLLAGVF